MWNLDRDRGGKKKVFFQRFFLHYNSTQTLQITSASVLFSESSGGAELVCEAGVSVTSHGLSAVW